MKTMSDFIMEQEVSTEVNDELDVVRGYMEMSAIGAVAECYCEHAAIAGFATEGGFSVFSESDDNILKKAWEATKSFFGKIWAWIKAMVQSVLSIFKRSSIDKCREKIQKGYNTGAFKEDDKCGISGVCCDAVEVLDLVEEFKDAVVVANDAAEGDKVSVSVKEMEKFIEKADRFTKGFKESKKAGWKDAGIDERKDVYKAGAKGEFTYRDLDYILELMQNANIPSRGSKLLKQIDFDKKNVVAKGKDTDKAVISSIKKAANALAKVYDKYQSETVKMVSKLLNKDLSEAKLEKLESDAAQRKATAAARRDGTGKEVSFKEESYTEHSDGYYFL